MTDAREVIANWLVDVDGIADEELCADNLIAALAGAGMVIVPIEKRSARKSRIADMDRVAHGVFGTGAADDVD